VDLRVETDTGGTDTGESGGGTGDGNGARSAEGFVVMADRGDLDRIFMNLISNGIKYNRDGGRLTVRLGEDREQDAVRVEVVDTGIGMTGREMESLFQEFYRVKNRKTSGISGTGLGLATVRRVLGGYNGRISCSSVPEEGTTFTVVFPRRAADRPPEEPS